MGRLDLMIELERDPSWDNKPKKDETRRPTRGTPSRTQDDQGTQNGSQLNNDHVTDVYKDYDLYLAARNGKLDAFSRVLDRVSAAEHASFGDILRRLSPAGNTFLHIAAKHGNEVIVIYIAANDPSLVFCKNSNGETALHLAAKGGYGSMVEAQNKDGESPLYLAAKAGSVRCIALILRSSTDQERINEQFKKKSPIQAAIMGKKKDVLEAMLNVNPSLIQLRDGEGRTPLHYAASLGYLEEARYLLDKYAPIATQRDNRGSFPIHMASINGHIAIISILLHFLDPEELLDRDGRNILHLAALCIWPPCTGIPKLSVY